VALTFVLVCIGWVFFRSATAGQAFEYLGFLFGMSHATLAADVVSRQLYAPYHVVIFLSAVLIVWKMPNSFAFTRTITLPRAAVTMTLLAMAIVVMWSQSANPFLYFRF
jgi:alginate O-acetyltransferase complex protein AlgI